MSRSGPYSGHSYTAPAPAVAAGQSSFQLSAADLQLAGWAGAGLPREADRQSEAGVLWLAVSEEWVQISRSASLASPAPGDEK